MSSFTVNVISRSISESLIPSSFLEFKAVKPIIMVGNVNSKKRLLLSTSLVHEAVLPASNDIYK